MWTSSRTWTHVGAEKEEEKNREKRRRAVRRERERERELRRGERGWKRDTRFVRHQLADR